MASDLTTALGRVFTRNQPTMGGLRSFVGDEIIGNAVGWTAGLFASWLVAQYFVRNSVWNLGGLTAQRAAVSGESLDWISWGTSYAVGLATLIFVKTFVLGTWRELIALRRERAAR